MKTFSIGNTATKRFTSVLRTPIIPADVGEFVHIEGYWPGGSYYLDGMEPKEKQLLPAVIDSTDINTGDVATITGLPPVTVSVDGEKVYVDDGVLTVKFNSPGEYSIIVDEPEWLYTIWVVLVND